MADQENREGVSSPIEFRRHDVDVSPAPLEPRQIDRFVSRFDRRALITPKPVPTKPGQQPATGMPPMLGQPDAKAERKAKEPRASRWASSGWFWIQALAACAMGFKGGMYLLRGLMHAH